MESIQKELKAIKEFIREQNILRKEILTLDEAALYLNQSKSSIYKLTSKKEIPHYSPGGKKIYFRRSEMDEWIFNSRIISSDELRSQIGFYIGKPSKI